MSPILIHSYTGLNLYDTYSFKDSLSYSEFFEADVAEARGTPLFHIRICLATMLFNFIVLFFFFLLNFNKLSGSFKNKAVMGASCVIVRGGFEGLGDPDLDSQHETQKYASNLNRSLSITEVERDSFSMSATQMEYHRQRENSKGTLPPVNYEGKAVPIPIQIGLSSSSRFMDFKSVIGLGNPCPWAITPPPRGTPNLPLPCSEGEDVVQVTPNISLPSSEGENGLQGREIERRVEQNLETNNKNFFISSKSSNSEASPNLISHGHGQLNNPASNRDMKSLLKDLFKKFK